MADKKQTKRQQAEQARDDVPQTIARSDDKAVRTFKKALESAEDQYGSGGRARRVAIAALKHTHEKVGDHWEPKERPGPSDRQAEKSSPESLNSDTPTASGVNANARKSHLVEVAQRLGIDRPDQMRKADLVGAIEKANARATREAGR